MYMYMYMYIYINACRVRKKSNDVSLKRIIRKFSIKVGLDQTTSY